MIKNATQLLLLLFLSPFYGFSQNPVLPEKWELNIADPEPKVFNGRVYVYGSKDLNLPGWCSDEYNVVSSSDLINWVDHGVSFRLSDVPAEYMDPEYRRLWAPDVVKHPVTGKYHLFFCFNHTRPRREKIMVAESDRPEGPFKNARPVTINGQSITAIDPGAMVDDDGKAYLTWPFKMAQLDPNDYSKLISNTLVDVEQWMPLYDTPFEGPSLRKRGDTYYYIYIQNNGPRYLPDSTTSVKPSKMAYMTSKNPLGPYEYKGNIIESTNYPGTINIHGSLVDFKGQWYVFYHLPVIDKPRTRRMSIEPVIFDSAGRILPAFISSSGVKDAFATGDTIYAAGAAVYSQPGDVRYVSRSGEKANLVFSTDSVSVGFRYVDFSKDAPKEAEVSVTTDGSGSVLELHLDKPDGPLLGSIPIPDTRGNWKKVKTTIQMDKIPGGKKTVFITLRSKNGKPLSFEWMRFL